MAPLRAATSFGMKWRTRRAEFVSEAKAMRGWAPWAKCRPQTATDRLREDRPARQGLAEEGTRTCGSMPRELSARYCCSESAN